MRPSRRFFSGLACFHASSVVLRTSTLTKASLTKLDARALWCVFVRYSSLQKGYKCYHPSSRRFFISANVTFAEYEPFFGDNSSSSRLLPVEAYLASTLEPFPCVEPPASLTTPPAPLSTPPAPLPTPLAPFSLLPSSPPKQLLELLIDCPSFLSDVLTSSQPEELPSSASGDTLLPSSVVSSSPPSLESFSSPFESSAIPPTSAPSSLPSPSTPLLGDPSHLSSSDNDDHLGWPIALRKGVRQCTRTPLYPLSHYLSFDRLSTPYQLFLAGIESDPIPCRLDDAIASSHWKATMDEEMQSLLKNHTWDVVPLSFGKKAVGCKWVHTKKRHADGTLERYKSRLIARGFTQSYRINYFETFAPVAKMKTVHLLLALAAHFQRIIRQFDVKNAFLHSDLTEEVYMQLPRGTLSALLALSADCRSLFVDRSNSRE